MTTAISLIIGLAIKNEKVTPSGIPASTKPINNGTDEQEQKGVTAPRSNAGFLLGECLWLYLKGQKQANQLVIQTLATSLVMDGLLCILFNLILSFL
jgi:hypothetical protein